MSELEDILNHLETTSLEPHDDYTDEFSYKDQKILWKYIKDLQQENQKLKSTLNLYKGSLHREHEAIHRANDLEEENQELKKQLEEQDYTVIPNSDIKPTLDKYKKQQKEFINYLEKEIVDSMVGGIQQYYAKNHLKIYKEIIGEHE